MEFNKTLEQKIEDKNNEMKIAKQKSAVQISNILLEGPQFGL